MDASRPSLPPKILVSDKVRPNEQTTEYMAARGCHFVECCLNVIVFIIRLFPHRARMVHRASCLV